MGKHVHVCVCVFSACAEPAPNPPGCPLLAQLSSHRPPGWPLREVGTSVLEGLEGPWWARQPNHVSWSAVSQP